MKSTIVVILLLSLASYSFAQIDGSCLANDANACSNGAGVCEPNGYCSCLSGAYGADCASTSSQTCTYADVEPNNVGFHSDFEFTLKDLKASFKVELPLEKRSTFEPAPKNWAYDTLINFPNHPSCSYPGPQGDYHWNKSVPTDCIDRYEYSVPWGKMGTECGFTLSENDHSGDNGVQMDLYSQTANVTRNYKIKLGNADDADAPTITRSLSDSHKLQVFVPRSVVVVYNSLSVDYTQPSPTTTGSSTPTTTTTDSSTTTTDSSTTTTDSSATTTDSSTTTTGSLTTTTGSSTPSTTTTGSSTGAVFCWDHSNGFSGDPWAFFSSNEEVTVSEGAVVYPPNKNYVSWLQFQAGVDEWSSYNMQFAIKLDGTGQAMIAFSSGRMSFSFNRYRPSTWYAQINGAESTYTPSYIERPATNELFFWLSVNSNTFTAWTSNIDNKATATVLISSTLQATERPSQAWLTPKFLIFSETTVRLTKAKFCYTGIGVSSTTDVSTGTTISTGTDISTGTTVSTGTDVSTGTTVTTTTTDSTVTSTTATTDVTSTTGTTSSTGPAPNVADSFSAVSGVAYDYESGMWKVTITAYTARPFKIQSILASYTPSMAFGDRAASVLEDGSSNPALIGECSSNTLGCTQSIVIYFQNCEEINGQIVLIAIMACSGGVETGVCDQPAALTITNTINVLNACPITINPKIIPTTKVFSDAGYSNTPEVFKYSETAFFTISAVAENNAVAISSLTIAQYNAIVMTVGGSDSNCVYTREQQTADGIKIRLPLTQFYQNDQTTKPVQFSFVIGIGYQSINNKREVEGVRGVEVATKIDMILKQDSVEIVQSSTQFITMTGNNTIESDIKPSLVANSAQNSNQMKIIIGVLSGVCGTLVAAVVAIFVVIMRRKQSYSRL